MFRDSLLESSSAARRRKRWPMATAFTLEIIVAAVVVIVPLLSTGVIPVSARIIYTPHEISAPNLPKPERACLGCKPTHGPAPAQQEVAVLLVNDNPNAIHYGKERNTTIDIYEAHPGPLNIGDDKGLPNDLMEHGNGTGVKPEGPHRIVSQLSEAYLVKRVEPVYPRTANIANVQGQVKLHAVIARDGRIMNLNVISGHPLLVGAAVDAVRQWQYRPYYLNNEPVEVETFITVNFRKEGR